MLYNEELTYRELYQWGAAQLMEAEVPEGKQDARLLLEWCCGTDQNTLLVHGERKISHKEYDRYRDCIGRRSGRMPLQYITGEQDFMGLTFKVNQHVLVPRQDTEILVEEIMRYLHDGMRILDLCTGSGCILLSLLHYSNDCTGVGTDISGEALQIARINAERILGSLPAEQTRGGKQERERLTGQGFSVAEAGERVIWLQGDLFERLDQAEKFDMIVSNPPYIRTSVIETLQPEVKVQEPRLALDGGDDGLFFYREIIGQAGSYLHAEGMLFLEIGYDQGEAVRQLMENVGYTEVEIVKDYAGLDRVVCGVYRDERQ